MWKHIGMISSGTLTSSSTDTSLVIISYSVELVDFSMLLNKLSQLSITARESEFVMTMSAQKIHRF